MAKKSRTPAPPRPVQAPKKRTEARDPRRTRMIAAVAGVVLLLAAAAGGIAWAVSRDGGGGAGEAAGACEIQTFESQGQEHVPPGELDEDFEYNSYPPTTGPHHPQTLVFAEYDRPVPQNNLLHNLEHGGVAVQYGPDISDEVRRQLVNWYRTDPRGIILAPLPDAEEEEQAAELSDGIALTAWVAHRENEDDPQARITGQEGVLALCSTFDQEEFDDFLDSYRARGPELFRVDDLAPGSQ